MIVTITMNPSIDIAYQIEDFRLGTVNRVENVKKTPGGKGLNVTRVLKEARVDVLASGLLGGSLGSEIRTRLKADGIKEQFSEIAGETRNCIAILHDREQTEILETGPTISESEARAFLDNFRSLAEIGNLITISGSLPRGLDKDFYAEVLAIANQSETPVLLDTSGSSLKAVLESQHKPLLIKPNREELSDLLTINITDDVSTLKEMLSQPLFNGIEWIVVSLGASGAFAKHKDHFYKVDIPKIQVVNPVGSGDATIAGLAAAIEAKASDRDVLKQANAFGMLNAQEATTGKINMNNYQETFDSIQVVEV